MHPTAVVKSAVLHQADLTFVPVVAAVAFVVTAAPDAVGFGIVLAAAAVMDSDPEVAQAHH